MGCTSLRKVNIPSNVDEISIYAFAYCADLRQISLNEGTKIIGYCAFAHCPKLQSASLPASVTDIGGNAFEGASPELTLSVPDQSYSLDYAVQNGFPYIIS